MKATEIYSVPIALVLHQVPDLDIAVANPKVINKYAGARL